MSRFHVISHYLGVLSVFLAIGAGSARANRILAPLCEIPAWQTAQVQAQPTPTNANAETLALAQAELNWIAEKKGWKKASLPTIKTAPERTLAIMLFGTPEGFEGIFPKALYDRALHVLYLSDRLTLDAVLDRSILLHELVHHLQVFNDIEFECREEAEAQAYELQVQWLSENGVKDPYALMGIPRQQITNLQCL